MMTRKFANFAQQVSGEDTEVQTTQQPEPQTTEQKKPRTRPSTPVHREKITAQVEAVKLVQARVPVSVQRQFSRTLIDIQDYFAKEVTQEEAIGALLALVNDDETTRMIWIDKLHSRRQ